MNSSINSVLWRILWKHGWIPINEFTYVTWLYSLILYWSGFSFKSVWVRKQILLIQSNNDPFLSVSSLPEFRLLCCSCSVATGQRCCHGRLLVLLHTARWGGLEGLFKHKMDVTGIKICLACLSAIKKTLETIKLRGITGNLKDTIEMKQFNLQKAKKQDSRLSIRRRQIIVMLCITIINHCITIIKVMQCITLTANVSQVMTLGIHVGPLSWRMLSRVLLNAALCQHRQFQIQASHYWESTRSSIFKKFSSWEKYCWMEQKT